MCRCYSLATETATAAPVSGSTREALPTALVPKHYNIYLAPDLESFEYDGTVAIDVDVVEATSTVVLNSKKLKISKAVVLHTNTPGAYRRQEATAITFDEEKEQVTFAFEEEIPAGSTATVTVDFVGVHNDAMAGFYRSATTDSEGKKQYLAVTQFEATDARQAFPCFDEPGLKATFDSTLVVAEDLIALSNMNVISTTPFINAAGKKVKEVKFATTPVMSTYLVAYAVGDFDYIETTATPKLPVDAQEITVRVYTPKGQVELGRFALECGARTLEFFSEYFNAAYPLPKMDMIAVPDFNMGAMENWGLVTYRTTALLCDEKTSTANSKGAVASVVGHELAHQWFGNLVTMQWWNDLWLNEGFATFVGQMVTDHLFPEWNIFTQFVTSGGQLCQEIMQIFDGISYLKGASLIRMLNNFLGREVFMNGIRTYLQEFKFKNTVTDDLWKHLSARQELMFPLLLTGPISIVFGEKQGTITFPYDSSENAFWKLNSGASGLYRVKYTDAQIASIGRILKTNLNTFTVGDRIQFLNDGLALAKANTSTITDLLNLINNLDSETDFNEGIKTLGRNVFAPVVAKLGYEFPAGEDYEVAQTRVLAIGASQLNGSTEVNAELVARFNRFLAGDKEALHPEIKTVAIRAALSSTTEENAEEVFNSVLALLQDPATLPQEASEIRGVLGAINSAPLVDRLLNEIMWNPDIIRPQDILDPIAGVARFGYAPAVLRPALIKFFQANFKRAQDLVGEGGHLLGYFVHVSVFTSIGKDVVEEVRAWTRGDGLEGAELEQRKKDVASMQRVINQCLESVGTNTVFLENQLPALQSFVATL
ncbi:hypothetical protein BCR33DRAFT_763937 [Rhizoclosmatium globosum]|uniref:Aminopeptidase n=1 Tax=Rhizoclosmatium globosum TaxID=329046 RepID=A0A1Y2CPG4_9FUNG|nr:hypothetical protein BCR33DRAFT_763937 [Rhizoclosmatium globosum]|eukprot:ORY48215.1 hypothetical protein BCR33DRAFT_763937 [Rhizoclosmatium globosum]